jgi:hypothetical protein
MLQTTNDDDFILFEWSSIESEQSSMAKELDSLSSGQLLLSYRVSMFFCNLPQASKSLHLH